MIEIIPDGLIIGVVVCIVVAGSSTMVALLMLLGHWAIDRIIRSVKYYAVWLEFAEFYREKHKRKTMK